MIFDEPISLGDVKDLLENLEIGTIVSGGGDYRHWDHKMSSKHALKYVDENFSPGDKEYFKGNFQIFEDNESIACYFDLQKRNKESGPLSNLVSSVFSKEVSLVYYLAKDSERGI